MLMTYSAGNAFINLIDLEAPANTIIYKPFKSPERIEAFTRVAEAAKKGGSLIVMQINHAGRQVPEFLNPNLVSAGDVRLDLGEGAGMTNLSRSNKGRAAKFPLVDRFLTNSLGINELQNDKGEYAGVCEVISRVNHR